MTDLKTVERDRAGLTRSRILVFYHFRPGCARLSFYARGGGALCQARTRRHRVGLRRLVRPGRRHERHETHASTARRKGRIRLMDRCLLAYMAILLAQSAYSLFSAAALGHGDRAALTSSSAPPLRLSSAISSAPTTAWRPRPARTTRTTACRWSRRPASGSSAC